MPEHIKARLPTTSCMLNIKTLCHLISRQIWLCSIMPNQAFTDQVDFQRLKGWQCLKARQIFVLRRFGRTQDINILFWISNLARFSSLRFRQIAAPTKNAEEAKTGYVVCAKKSFIGKTSFRNEFLKFGLIRFFWTSSYVASWYQLDPNSALPVVYKVVSATRSSNVG